MKSIIELQAQIDKLTKQANEIKHRERDKTVLEIKAKMHAFGITQRDLMTSKPTKAVRRKVQTVPAKYKGPNGETWSGRGMLPKWLSSLVAQGQGRDEYLIKPE